MTGIMVLGALLGLNPLVDTTSIMDSLAKILPERYHKLLPANQKALSMGQTMAVCQNKAHQNQVAA